MFERVLDSGGGRGRGGSSDRDEVGGRFDVLAEG